jgi:AcrR family transcriptional regulator
MARMTRAERQAHTVRDLLAAAEAEFSARGYAAVTVDSIAERAGYTRGAVYGNFPAGKPDLFLQVAETRAARYVDEINAALATADGEAIAEVYLGVRSRARSTPGWGRALVEFGLVAADDGSLRERFAALRRATVDRVRSGFEALGPEASFDARDLATVVVALEAGLDLLRWVDPALVDDDLEYRVIGRLGGWEDPSDPAG